MAPQLEYLTSDQPYGTAVIDWLWERRDVLPEVMVIVPTAQSSRRVRQGLAEKGGALAPLVMTPGSLLQSGKAAPPAVEVLAWAEELEGVQDWAAFEAVFPKSPAEESPGWSGGLARSFHDLRMSLQEGGLLIRDVAKQIDALEKDRWSQLARLESGVERRLKEWGYRSKSSELAVRNVILPERTRTIIVAGVFDLPPVLSDLLERSDREIQILMPGIDEVNVDSWGRPLPDWSSVEIAWPKSGSVSLTGNPSQQADLAVRLVGEAESSSESVGLGTGDEEVAAELVRSFARAGWTVHDPGASLPSPLAGWLGAWRRYLLNPGLKEVIDLLPFDQGRAMIKGLRAGKVVALSGLRDAYLSRSLDDVRRALVLIEEALEASRSESKSKRLEFQLRAAREAEDVMMEFEAYRTRFQREGFHQGMRNLLSWIDGGGEAGLEEWLEATVEAAGQVERSPIFWIDLLLADLNPLSEDAPDGRTLDVQGWLELLHDPADHLVICGMNEGRVPGRASSDSWLTEGARQQLGLPNDESRSARDAFLLNALLKMREGNGRVDLIVGKVSQGGDVLLPSRLLLTAKGEKLAEQVQQLFAEVEPPDSGVAWHLEDHWKWKPKKVEPREKISVTAFSKYLACPFRYYLSRVIGMNETDPERVEWNHRDFGNIMHEVLEQWGRDELARDSADPNEIRGWTEEALTVLVEKHFGKSLPLAVSLQVESMRLRLGWFAEAQSATRQEGWRIKFVEEDFEIDIDGVKVTGQVDRVDEHENGDLRVLDYKTSKDAKDVVKEHLRTIRGDVPEHLQHDEVVAPDGQIWSNLQVPLYARALERVTSVGYFALGEDRKNVTIKEWSEFDEEVTDSAMKCASWVIGQIQAQVFWPPAEKVMYDDFTSLAFGHPLANSLVWEGGKS
ncbi:MAG: PD-(D/E)XK nuclease family protein [Akkermansiaceae bacterium]